MPTWHNKSKNARGRNKTLDSRFSNWKWERESEDERKQTAVMEEGRGQVFLLSAKAKV